MTSWEQRSRKDQLAATHYDFYKDVHGIRPRWFNYDEMTEAELEAALDQLGKESEIQAKIEAEAEAIATDKVEFVDISEDLQGYDLMTFIYEGKEMQSRITSRPV
jgi:hypothetical protein